MANPARRRRPRELSGFAGTYVHPAYGELTIRVGDGELVPDFHAVGDRLRMTHRGHDTWDLVFVEYDEDSPMVFSQGADGAINGLSVALEPAVAPAVFSRRPEPPSEGLLDGVTGSYRMGPTTLHVRRRGEHELIASSDLLGELVLVAAGGTTFTCPAMPGVHVTAEVDQLETVLRLVVGHVGSFVREAS